MTGLVAAFAPTAKANDGVCDGAATAAAADDGVVVGAATAVAADLQDVGELLRRRRQNCGPLQRRDGSRRRMTGS